MVFKVPEFPLTAGIYSGPWLSKVHRADSPANLAPGRRNYPFPSFDESQDLIYTGNFTLLLPPGTDVRDMNCNLPTNDLVEVPAGSGCWYGIALVGDSGKGFANAFRWVLMNKISERVHAVFFAGLFWPTPIP